MVDEGEDIATLRRELERARKQISELEGADDELATIFRMSLDLICIADIDTATFVKINRAFCDTLGYSEQALLGRTFLELIHPDDVEPTRQVIEEQLKTGQSVLHFANRYRTADGDYRWLEWTSQPNLETGSTFAIARDITERRRSEQELSQARALMLAAIAQSPSGIVIADAPDVKIRFANPAALGIRGSTDVPLTGIDLDAHPSAWQLCHPDGSPYQPEELPLTRAILQGITSENMEMVIRNDQGESRFLSVNAAPVLDGDQKIVSGIVVFHDITDRKRVEEALRESEERFRGLFEESPLMIAVCETEAGIFTEVNHTTAATLKYGSEELVGRSPVEMGLFDTDMSERYQSALTSVGGLNGKETVFRAKDGEQVPVLVFARTVELRSGAALMLMAMDITRQKQLEQQFRQAQKMEAVGQLAGGVAHDFNNLLTGILGNIDLARMDMHDSDAVADVLEEIEGAARRAADLTGQLLAFSRKKVISPKVLNLNDLVRKMSRMLRRIIGEDIALELHLSEDLGRIRADPSQIEQIILNLSVNARDAMAQGGRLTIETYRMPQAAGSKGSRIGLAVRDNGKGISKQDLARVFEPFFTTKPKGQGTGLGLSTVYGLVKQHGGSVEVESEVGAGTTVELALPEVSATPDPTPSAPEQTRPAGTETILIVEDEPVVRAAASKALARLGYRVLLAEDATSGFDRAGAHGAGIDLLLTDVVMPGMNGRQLASQLLAIHPELKVLYMSGYTDDVIAEHGALEPGIKLISKPFSPLELARRVREVLDQD